MRISENLVHWAADQLEKKPIGTAEKTSRVGSKWIAERIAKTENKSWGFSVFGGIFVGPKDQLKNIGVIIEGNYEKDNV
jgi:hypothetical protein